jgi:hypothetical protein
MLGRPSRDSEPLIFWPGVKLRSRVAPASRSANVRLEAWFCGEVELKRGGDVMSIGEAVCAMSRKDRGGGGESGKRGKLQSPASSNSTSESTKELRDDAPSSCGFRCHEK